MIYLAEVIFTGKQSLKNTTQYYLVFGFTRTHAWNRAEKKLYKMHGELNTVSVIVRPII